MGWNILPGELYLTYPLKNCILLPDGHGSMMTFISLTIRNSLISISTLAAPELAECSICVPSTCVVPGPGTLVEM